MVDAVGRLGDQVADCSCHIMGIRRVTDLVVDDRQMVTFFSQALDSADKVACATKDPGDPHDIESSQQLGHELFAEELRARICVDWIGLIPLVVRLYPGAVEDFVGADVNQGNIQVLACQCHALGTQTIDQDGALWIACATVHIGPCSGMNHQVWLSSDDLLSHAARSDIERSRGGRYDIVASFELAYECATDLSARSSNEYSHLSPSVRRCGMVGYGSGSCQTPVGSQLVTAGILRRLGKTADEDAMTQPLIGITTHATTESDRETLDRFLDQIIRGVEEAGGLPVLIPMGLHEATLRGVFARLDGLLLTGGGDIDPAHYGTTATAVVEGIDPVRDQVELALARWAFGERKPVFGICRGLQVMNVAGGGTLYRDISQYPGAHPHTYYPDYPLDLTPHTVEIDPASRLGPQAPGVIVAERSEFQDLVVAAQRIANQASDFFARANHLIDENSDSVTASVKNVETISGTLAAKSDDVKTIIADFASLSAKLDKAADKFDSVFTRSQRLSRDR